jgi:Sel1 repeat
VLIDAKIWGDGRAHDPRADYSIPEQLFEGAGRAVALNNVHKRPIDNGVAVPCSLRFKVKFSFPYAAATDPRFEKFDEVRKGAENGDARSQLLYALMLDMRPDLNPTADKDVWFLKAAQAGIPAAQFKVGHRTLSGYGFETDEAKAIIWLDKAASAGNLDAQIALANYYMRDMANTANVAKGAAWFERALEKSLEARFYLSALLASNPDAAFRNPQRALDIVKEGLESYDVNPIAFEIRAAALANLGDFAGAQRNQTKAVGMAKRLGWDTTPQKARLAAYQANQGWAGDLFALY